MNKTERVSLALIDENIRAGDLTRARELIRLGIRQRLDFQGRHVGYAHALLSGMPWNEVSALLPAKTNSLEASGWLRSIGSGRPVNESGEAIPWFTYPAIDFLETILRPEWRVFEWGSGNSTLWWARRCGSVHAVESHASWHREVSRKLPENASIRLAEEREAYLGEIGRAFREGGAFDVIVIDGLHRSDCAKDCLRYLAENGVVVFDNSDEEKHREGVTFLTASGMIRIDHYGLIPSYLYRNCTSVFVRNPEILRNLPVPQDHRSDLGLSCGQAIDALTSGKRMHAPAVARRRGSGSGAGPAILFSYHNPIDYMAPQRLSENQVVCGPFIEDWSEGERVRGIRTRAGEYDIREVVKRLPADQYPELIVVKADAARNNFPRNIASLGIPSVLILGDTMHMKDPLQVMLNYAAVEKFSLYVSDHKRHHLHWFSELGVGPIAWTPGLFVQDHNLGFSEERSADIRFVGQSGSEFHPYRHFMLKELATRIPNLRVGRASQEEASRIYNRSRASLNFSLNGDLNLRVFEVMAAGGCLVTDRLSPQSGMDLLFKDGEDLLSYRTLDELLLILEDLNRNPRRAVRIAERGFATFKRSHSPERKRRDFLDTLAAGKGKGSFDLPADPRCAAFASPSRDELFRRVRMYEWFQEMHRRNRNLHVLFKSGSDLRLACDLVDLPRHRISVREFDADLFSRAGVEGQIRLDSGGERADVCVYKDTDLSDFPDSRYALIQRLPDGAQLLALNLVIGEFGYEPDERLPGLFRRKN